MKNNYFKFRPFLFFTLVILIIGISCSSEDKEFINEKDNFSLADAKNWFEQNIKEKPKFILQNDEISLTPNWAQASYFKNQEIEVFEIPYTSDKYFGYNITIQEQKYYSEISNKVSDTPNFKMIITRNKAGEVDAFTMLIIPEANRNIDLNKNTYLSLENDFSGIISFYDFNSMLVSGKEYIYGNVSNEFSLNGKMAKAGGNNDDDCFPSFAQHVSTTYFLQSGSCIMSYVYTLNHSGGSNCPGTTYHETLSFVDSSYCLENVGGSGGGGGNTEPLPLPGGDGGFQGEKDDNPIAP